MPHISLSDHADLIIIAPATANIIGKFAGGVGDDFLSTLLLSARPPVLVAPAMNPRMWAAPAVQENVAALRARGHLVMEPGVGRMARAEEGTGRGRMPEPGEILLAARAILLPNPDPGGHEARGHGGTHAGEMGRRALSLEPLERQDGLRPGGRSREARRGRRSRERPRRSRQTLRARASCAWNRPPRCTRR